MHHVNLGNQLAFLGLFIIILSMFGWWQNIIFETYNEGNHTAAVQLGLRFGMLLFIISEVMFFFGFFWAFFHASLSPSIEIGAV
jgi:heme/copper-type cytochrome/quinol oxidase subunit 3